MQFISFHVCPLFSTYLIDWNSTRRVLRISNKSYARPELENAAFQTTFTLTSNTKERIGFKNRQVVSQKYPRFPERPTHGGNGARHACRSPRRTSTTHHTLVRCTRSAPLALVTTFTLRSLLRSVAGSARDSGNNWRILRSQVYEGLWKIPLCLSYFRRMLNLCSLTPKIAFIYLHYLIFS